MREGYPGIAFETIGVPRDLASAERLAADDPHQFQQWVCWQVGFFPAMQFMTLAELFQGKKPI